MSKRKKRNDKKTIEKGYKKDFGGAPASHHEMVKDSKSIIGSIKLNEEYSVKVYVGNRRPYTIFKSSIEAIETAKVRHSKKHADSIVKFGKINKS